MSRWKDIIRKSSLFRPLRMARLRYIARHAGHEDWPEKLKADWSEWNRALASTSGPKVLIATSMGGHFALNAIDRMLAIALTLRGARVSLALCDGALTACQMCEYNLFGDEQRFIQFGPARDICGYCSGPSVQASRKLGLEVDLYGEYLTGEDRREAGDMARSVPAADIRSFLWRDLPVGEHAYAGALRFFARGDLEKEPNSEAVLRRYLEASILMAASFEKLLEQKRPDVILAHHGIYVPQGLIAAVAHKKNVRVVTWNQAYRAQCFMFSHAETYHHTMMNEPAGIWCDQELSTSQRELIISYLKSRWQGSADWISFHQKPDFSLTEDVRRLGIDPARPFILALTNVFWDAQIHYPANAFSSQKEWLVETIKWFAQRPHLQLVIRVHPAELSGTPQSRQFAADVLKEEFVELPANIIFVGPDSPVSTYDLARSCDTAIIFATKTGVELTAMGIPTIVAGEAWIRGKGMTMDAETKADYFNLLDHLPLINRLDAATVERAYKFAFHFFFRRMIPLSFVKSYAGPRRFENAIQNLDELRPGADAGLDTICRGVLEGTPFHMDEAAALAFVGKHNERN